MLRLVRHIHSCSGGSRPYLHHAVRVAALLAALVLVHTNSAALQSAAEQPTPIQADSTAMPAQSSSSQARATDAEMTSDVDLQVEVVPAAANGEPTVTVQVDGKPVSTTVPVAKASTSSDPRTSSAQLAPVAVMEANDQPVHSGIATVHFRVHATSGHPLKPSPLPPRELRGAAPAPPPVPDELRDTPDPSFSLKGSPLPILALIGFLLLVGGFLPPMRARKPTARTRIAHP